MSQTVSRRGAVRMIVVSVVVAVLVAVPASVWAVYQFADVTTSTPYHAEIGALADAGITTSFPGNRYRPGADVTRQALAAFLERGLGRLGTDDFSASLLTSDAATHLSALWIDSGAAVQGTGFVLLTGTAEFTAPNPAGCPCRVELSIFDQANPATLLGVANVDVPGAADDTGGSVITATVQAAVSLAADRTGRYGLDGFLHNSGTPVNAKGTFTALYVPLGPDGDNTLSYCAKDEGEPNNTLAAARAAMQVNGCIAPLGDVDVFKVNVPDSTQVIARTWGLGGQGTCDMDTVIRIRDANGTLIAQDDNAGPENCSTAASAYLTAGTYYVELVGTGTDNTGSYSLDIQLHAFPG